MIFFVNHFRQYQKIIKRITFLFTTSFLFYIQQKNHHLFNRVHLVVIKNNHQNMFHFAAETQNGQWPRNTEYPIILLSENQSINRSKQAAFDLK